MRALVVGAGISGLSAAGALARNGWETTVLEQAPGPRKAGYMIDFFGPGFAAADSLGALDHLRHYGQLYAQARYVDAAGRTRARLSMDSFLNAADGKFFSILRPDMERGLREWVGKTADIVHGAKVISVDPGAGGMASVVLRDGRRLEAELLVGADGIHSAVRSGLPDSAGEHPSIPAAGMLRHLGFHVFGYVFDDPGMAARLGRDVVLTDTLVRQAGLYALPDGRVAFFGVIECTDPDPGRVAREELFARFSGLGQEIDEALARRPADMFEDVVAQSVVPRWSAGRCVVIGDAAHAVSLLAGQGASLAIAGAELLARTLRDHGNDLAAAFADYEGNWRPVVERQQAAGRRNARFFVPRNGRGLLLRRWALHVMGIGPMNAFAARRAFGAALPGKGRARP